MSSTFGLCPSGVRRGLRLAVGSMLLEEKEAKRVQGQRGWDRSVLINPASTHARDVRKRHQGALNKLAGDVGAWGVELKQ